MLNFSISKFLNIYGIKQEIQRDMQIMCATVYIYNRQTLQYQMSFFFKCCKGGNTSGQYYQIDRKEGNIIKTEYVDNIKDFKDWNKAGRVLKVNRSEYDELVQKSTVNNKWTDPTFPPGPKSLGNINNVPSDCEWKRLSQIIQRPQLFVDRIQPQDVVQGSLGDCYFLSAVSALAEKQGRITNVFGNQKYNPAGIYKVTLRVDGVIQEILIDDYVPVNKSNRPLFCQPKNSEIWVLLLEKAWAKANGSYANINSGTPSQVFKAVTYAPSQLRPIKNQPQYLDKLWEDIVSASKKDNPVCCGTSTSNTINWNAAGLTPGHAYTLVDAAAIKDEEGRVHRMLKIRNPWGYNQWTGRGNQADQAFWSRIPPNQRKIFEIKSEHRNDGLFYMSFEDFYQHFNQIHFCHLLDHPMYEIEPMHADSKHGSIFTLNVKQQDDYIIQLHQNGIRGKNDARLKQGLNRSTLLISKGNNYEFIDGSLKYQEEDNSLKVHLTPGQYYVYAKIDPTLGQGLMPQTMSVSSYSNHYVDIVPVDGKAHPDFFSKVFLSYARNNRRKQFNNGLMWISWKLFFQKGGFAYLGFGVDPRSDKKFVVTIDENDFSNLGFTLKKPHKGKGKQVLQIRPGQQQIIVARVKNAPLQPMKFPPPMDIQIDLA